jgi:hypothetical protein
MAHFAEIDENNVVLRILVVPDSQEQRGNDYLSNDLGLGGTWIQTSYNNNIRKRYAGIGSIYNEQLDVFLYPKPFDSWVLNYNLEWVAPIEYPNDGKYYIWNENLKSWEESII